MRILMILITLSFLFTVPVSAMEFYAPTVPEGAEEYMPEDTSDFGESLLQILKKVLVRLEPELVSVAGTCLQLIAVTLIFSIIRSFEGKNSFVIRLAAAVAISILLLQPSKTLIQLGKETVTSISTYGKLLLPVMTAAMAAQGLTNSSASLYTATAVFNTVLSELIAQFIIPMLFFYICIGIADCAVGMDILRKIKKFLKWAITWSLKTVLYLFTGYISITGVISGSADASIVKATKLTISGMVPVVGGLLADASETIVISAGIMKNSAGVFGILAMLSIFISPFLQIGIQYLLLNITSGVCGILGSENTAQSLIDDFCTVMGYLLAMTGTVCLLFLISIICFMRGTV